LILDAFEHILCLLTRLARLLHACSSIKMTIDVGEVKVMVVVSG
jgi:hypothetical protein